MLADVLVGCDFGAPQQPADQAKKIILIEAVRAARGQYVVLPSGRNLRLIHWLDAAGLGGAEPSSGEPATCAPQRLRTSTRRSRNSIGPRAGWTVAELAASLIASPVRCGGFDFPFGIPQSLLMDAQFARAVGEEQAFGSHAAWARYVAMQLPLHEPQWVCDDTAVLLHRSWQERSGERLDFTPFAGWKRDSRYWLKRATDVATRAQPPLKHVGQSLFGMTLAGCSLLHRVQTGENSELSSGVTIFRGSVEQLSSTALQQGSHSMLFETYPAGVARRIGFAGSYKQLPVECMRAALAFLEQHGIRLMLHPAVERFCSVYRTGGDDPDGADALLCLVAAICFDCGLSESLPGGASPQQLDDEGVIVLPRAAEP